MRSTRHVERENEELRQEIAKMKLHSAPSSRLPTYPQLEYVKEVVDSGQAIVYKGTYKGAPVAIKIFKHGGYQEELDSLLNLGKHPNIISIVTCFNSPKPCLVTTWYSKGDLAQFLLENGGMEGGELRKMATGIAKGISYLHSKGIIHRDLKSGNIFIGDGVRPVIADFGLSKISNRNMTVLSGVMGTERWMAPEVMRSLPEISNKIDVYAFGIILWELMSGQIPFHSIDNVKYHVMSGKRCEINHSWDRDLVELMKRCWDDNPDKRPPITEVSSRLENRSDRTSGSMGIRREIVKREPELRDRSITTDPSHRGFFSRRERELEERERELEERKRELARREREVQERERKRMESERERAERERKRMESERYRMEEIERAERERKRMESERYRAERYRMEEIERAERERKRMESERERAHSGTHSTRCLLCSSPHFDKRILCPLCSSLNPNPSHRHSLPPPSPEYNMYAWRPL